jgi:hypothetical protein
MKSRRFVMIKMDEIEKNILLSLKHPMPYRHAIGRAQNPIELC